MNSEKKLKLKEMTKRTNYFLVIMITVIASASNDVYAEIEKINFENKLSLNSDDNIYRRPMNDEISDKFYLFQPKINFIQNYKNYIFSLDYDGEYAKFNKYKDTNYYDHKIDTGLLFDYSDRLKLKLEAGFDRAHENPGTIDRIQTDILEFNKFQTNFQSIYANYGSEDSTGNISLSFRRTSRNYLNNDLDYLDSVFNQTNTRFTYRFSQKTKFIIEANYSTSEYDPPIEFIPLDSQQVRYSAGASWNFSNKLTGIVTAGYQTRDYEVEELIDIKGLSYSIEIDWKIENNNELAIKAHRETIDSSMINSGGAFRSTYNLIYSHKFNSDYFISFDTQLIDDELVLRQNRRDKRYRTRFALGKNLGQHLEFEAYVLKEKRNSSVMVAEYDSEIYGINLIFNWEK